MSSPDFAFDTEFTLLDVGATGALVRSGGVRPCVLAYLEQAGPESAVLEWPEDAGPEHAFEEARRWLRGLRPVAYAFVAAMCRNGEETVYLRGNEKVREGAQLGLALFTSTGAIRGSLYPVRQGPTGHTLGVPTPTDADSADWCPIGDVWSNPFCLGDTVRFLPPARAVEPDSPLWKAMVDLTKLRVQTDRYKSQEYMLFLDDLRNGLFVVAGRSTSDPMMVALKPRTTYNPLGYLVAHASKLALVEAEETSSEGGSSQ